MVEGEVSSSEDVKQPDLQAEYRDVAIRCCNLFIDHCRVVTRAPFLVGVEQHYRLQDGRYYVLTPHSISWFDGDSGDSLPAYEGDVNSVATSGAVRSPERGLASMRAIQQSIEQGIQPDLIHSLLLDAEERLVTLRIREAVISLATACEVASNIYIRHQGREDDDQIRRILRQRASFAEKRFHLITTLLCSLRNP